MIIEKDRQRSNKAKQDQTKPNRAKRLEPNRVKGAKMGKTRPSHSGDDY